MGCTASSIFYFFKGFYNSPKHTRLMAGITHLRRRAPIMGGTYALWAGMFSLIDLSIYKIRGKSDWKNAVAGGAGTGFLLSWRSGLRVALKNGVSGGFLLAIICGVELGSEKWMLRKDLKEK